MSHSNTETHLSYLVQPNLHGKRQRLPSLKVLWMNIFSYSGPTDFADFFGYFQAS